MLTPSDIKKCIQNFTATTCDCALQLIWRAAERSTPDLAALEAVLLGRRFPAADIPPVDAPGLYALFLAPGAALPPLTVGPTGLLYVGMTDSSLDVRNHFRHAHSGFSTLRRSLGALLNTPAAITASKAGFRSLGDIWADTTTAHGGLMLTVLGGLAEFERNLIRARTGEGRERAMAPGVKIGRKPKPTSHQQREAIKRRDKVRRADRRRRP